MSDNEHATSGDEIVRLGEEVAQLDGLPRVVYTRLAKYRVTQEDIQERHGVVVALANLVNGPQIMYDDERKCYGLVAEKSYEPGERVTTYGGVLSTGPVYGDYAGALGDNTFINGFFGFMLSEKGRWINESDRERAVVNVSLGREIRATTHIEAGEWIFADYGPEYARTY